MKESGICVEEPTEFTSILLHSLYPEQEPLFPGENTFYDTSLNSESIKPSEDKEELQYSPFRWKGSYGITDQTDGDVLPKPALDIPPTRTPKSAKVELKTKECSVLVTRLSRTLLSKVDTKSHEKLFGTNESLQDVPLSSNPRERKHSLDSKTDNCLSRSAFSLNQNEDTTLSFSEDSSSLIIPKSICDTKTMNSSDRFFASCGRMVTNIKDDHSSRNGYFSDSPPMLESANSLFLPYEDTTNDLNRLMKCASSRDVRNCGEIQSDALYDGEPSHKLENKRLCFYDEKPMDSSSYGTYNGIKLNGFPPESGAKDPLDPYKTWSDEEEDTEQRSYGSFSTPKLLSLHLNYNSQTNSDIEDISKSSNKLKEYPFGANFLNPKNIPETKIEPKYVPDLETLSTHSSLPDITDVLYEPSQSKPKVSSGPRNEADSPSIPAEKTELSRTIGASNLDICVSEDSDGTGKETESSHNVKKKVSPLSVYTNVDGTSITHVICKRYKKRSKKNSENDPTPDTMMASLPKPLPPTLKCPKVKRKPNSMRFKPAEEPENVEETVADVLGDLLNRVFFMSIKREKAEDLNAEDPRTRDLVERFCADYCLKYEEFKDTEDLFAVRIVEKDDEKCCSMVKRRRHTRKHLSSLEDGADNCNQDDHQIGDGDHHSNDDYRVLRKLPGRIKRKHLRGGEVIKRFYTRSTNKSMTDSVEKPRSPETREKEEEKMVIEDKANDDPEIEEVPLISDAPLVIDITDDEDDNEQMDRSKETDKQVEDRKVKEIGSSQSAMVPKLDSCSIVDCFKSCGECISGDGRNKVASGSQDMNKISGELDNFTSSRGEDYDEGLDRKRPPQLVPADINDHKMYLLDSISDGNTTSPSSGSKQVSSKEIRFPSRLSREKKRIDPQPPYSKRPLEDDRKFAWSVPKRRYTMSLQEDPRPSSVGTNEDSPHNVPKPDIPLDLTSNDAAMTSIKPRAPVQKVNPTVQPKKVLHARFVNEMALEKQKEDDVLGDSTSRTPQFSPNSQSNNKDAPKLSSPSPRQISLSQNHLEDLTLGSVEESAAERQAREREESILRTLLLDSGRLSDGVQDEDGNYHSTPIITKVVSLSDGRTTSPPLLRQKDKESAVCEVSPLVGSSDLQPSTTECATVSPMAQPPSQRNLPFELFKDGIPHLKEQTIVNLLREGQREAWINDPQQMREKIRKLKNEIVYLQLVAEQKEKERIAILYFKKYKEEILRRVYKLHSMTKQETQKRYPPSSGEDQIGREYHQPQQQRPPTTVTTNSNQHHQQQQQQKMSPHHHHHHHHQRHHPQKPQPQEDKPNGIKQPELRPILPKTAEEYQGIRENGGPSSQLHPAYFAGCNKGTCLVRPLVMQEGRKNASESLPSVEALVAKANENYGVNLNHLPEDPLREHVRRQSESIAGMGEILQRVLSGREYRTHKDSRSTETSPPALLDQGYGLTSMMPLKNSYQPNFIPLSTMSSRSFQSHEDVLNYSKNPPTFYKEPTGGKPAASAGHIHHHASSTQSPPTKTIPAAPRPSWNHGNLLVVPPGDGHRSVHGDAHGRVAPSSDTHRTHHLGTGEGQHRTHVPSGDAVHRTPTRVSPSDIHHSKTHGVVASPVGDAHIRTSESRSVIRHSNVITCSTGQISPVYSAASSATAKYTSVLSNHHPSGIKPCSTGDMKEKMAAPRSEGSYMPERRNENRPVIVPSVMPSSGLLPFGNKVMRNTLESGSVPSCPRCMGCGILDAKYLCSGCRKHWYCSSECQTLRWPEHSRVCAGRTFQTDQDN